MGVAAVNRGAGNSNSELQKNSFMLMFVCKSSQLRQSLHRGEVEGAEELLEYNSCEAGFGFWHFQLALATVISNCQAFHVSCQQTHDT